MTHFFNTLFSAALGVETNLQKRSYTTEGSWEKWVILAREILNEDQKRKTAGYKMIPVEWVCHYQNLSAGEHARLTITDTGHGMDREELERIFDPFYTTKIQDNSRGLGLSMVHGIIKNHGGEISVNSIVGIGTTFVILLPLIDPLNRKNILH